MTEFKHCPMKIKNREVSNQNYLDPVTYIPGHANGDASHPDCEQGVIIEVTSSFIRVMFCKSRTVQSTRPEDLVWG